MEMAARRNTADHASAVGQEEVDQRPQRRRGGVADVWLLLSRIQLDSCGVSLSAPLEAQYPHTATRALSVIIKRFGKLGILQRNSSHNTEHHGIGDLERDGVGIF